MPSAFQFAIPSLLALDIFIAFIRKAALLLLPANQRLVTAPLCAQDWTDFKKKLARFIYFA